MAKLEELTRGAWIRGILPDALATVVDVQWFGSEALEEGERAAGSPELLTQIGALTRKWSRT